MFCFVMVMSNMLFCHGYVQHVISLWFFIVVAVLPNITDLNCLKISAKCNMVWSVYQENVLHLCNVAALSLQCSFL